MITYDHHIAIMILGSGAGSFGLRIPQDFSLLICFNDVFPVAR